MNNNASFMLNILLYYRINSCPYREIYHKNIGNKYLPVTIHSGLKCSSQTKILFASILCFSSAVVSRVPRIKRSHSSRPFRFNSFVCSPSTDFTEGILNSESLCLPLVGQPKKAQLPPPVRPRTPLNITV